MFQAFDEPTRAGAMTTTADGLPDAQRQQRAPQQNFESIDFSSGGNGRIETSSCGSQAEGDGGMR